MDGARDDNGNADGRRAVLVVDDEDDIRETLAEILEIAGYSVDTATSGLDGLARLGARDYHAVISDVSMPGMNGMEFYRHLARGNTALETRFVLVTGDSLGGAVRQFLDETGVPCIEKPFAPDEVRRVLAARLGPPR